MVRKRLPSSLLVLLRVNLVVSGKLSKLKGPNVNVWFEALGAPSLGARELVDYEELNAMNSNKHRASNSRLSLYVRSCFDMSVGLL